MCGLFGWQLSPEAMREGDPLVLATVLAFNSERRGDDSWGVAMRNPAQVPAVTLLKNIGSIKKTCRVPHIVASQVLGHTRKMTTGAVSLRNAHPFAFGNIVGAHNGWLYEHHKLNTKHKRECQVDSEHIFMHLAEGKPVDDLEGLGTITYLNVQQPDIIYAGRSRTSEFAVMGIGPRTKPIGIVWCSVMNWLDEAISMAGYRENFVWPTQLKTLYRFENYECIEEGDFDFKQASWAGNNNTRVYGGGYSCGYGDYEGYRGRTSFDQRDYDKEKGVVQLPLKTSVSKSELDALPEHLKKNQEIGGLEEGQGKKAVAPDLQCMACGDFGRPVTSYEDDPDGILYFGSIDQDLCFQCAALWASNGRGVTNIVVPTLELKKRKEDKCTSSQPQHSVANLPQQPNKE